MSLTSENGSGMVMPVGPMYGNGGFGGAWGGDGFFWLLIIFVIALMGNGFGFGGFGGNGGTVNTINNDVQRGFDQQAVMGGLNGITAGINGLGMQLCNGFNAAEQAAATRQMMGMQNDFAMQTAMNQGFNSLAASQASCCCENRLGLANLSADIARENCADRQATADAMTALSNKMDNMYNALQMQNYQDKLDAKNERIQALENQLNMASFAASQNSQTAQLESGQRLLANEIEQYVNPTARPAYIVQNPNCCAQNTGCGCGNRFIA